MVEKFDENRILEVLAGGGKVSFACLQTKSNKID